MSFGFGVGDFIAVIELSKKIWDACKDSADEYRDIGKDVRQTYLIITAIQRFWQNEESNGHRILMADQNDLKEMEQACIVTLEKIEAELNKHRKLGLRGSLLDRVKWFGTDMGLLRQTLQNSNYQMAMFNATLVATNASSRSEEQLKLLKELKDQVKIQKAEQYLRLLKELKDQSRILEVVMKQYQEMQEGTSNKPPPAYSQMASKDVDEDTEIDWSVIRNDLKETELNEVELRQHAVFIMEWIETVSSTHDPQLSKPLDTNEESPKTASQNRDASQTEQRFHKTPPQSSSKDAQPLPSQSMPLLPLSPPNPIFQRPASANTHRSQSSSWRDPSLEVPNFAVNMVAKVLKSKYGDGNDELYILPIKRAYHFLDYSGNGWLTHEEVRRVCKEAASQAGVDFSDAQIASLVTSMDTNYDHEIDLQEFIGTVVKLREHIFAVIYENSQIAARVDAGVVLQSAFKSVANHYLLPYGSAYTFDFTLSSRGSTYKYAHNSFRPTQTLPPLRRNMATATYLATYFCATQVANARGLWRNSLLRITPRDAVEYNAALGNVARAIAKFHFLDPEGASVGWILDKCLDMLELIPLELFEDIKDGPWEELLVLRRELWGLLGPILGFVWHLKPTQRKIWVTSSPNQIFMDVSPDIPTLAEWRRLRLSKMAAQIDAAASQWTDMSPRFLRCVEWYSKNHALLLSRVNDALSETRSLYEAQLQADTEAQREITIDTVRMEGSSRKGLRFRYPKIYFKVSVDGSEYGYASETQQDTASPEWQFDRLCSGKGDSTIQLDFHRGHSWNYSFSQASKTFIGAYKFKMSDVTSFSREKFKVLSTGFLEEASSAVFSTSGKERVKVTVSVSSSWAPEETWENKDGGLPTELLKRPIPSNWEVRRTKQDDVYFFNKTTSKPTSCFWQDPVAAKKRTTVPRALPPGWRLAHHSKELLYLHIGQVGYVKEDDRPEVGKGSVFEHVLKCKSFCETSDFFSDIYLRSWEEESRR